MHLTALEQVRELMRYMNSLNEWLGRDVEDRQAELRGIAARVDRLNDDPNRLTRHCKLYHLYVPHIANIHSNPLTFSPTARWFLCTASSSGLILSAFRWCGTSL